MTKPRLDPKLLVVGSEVKLLALWGKTNTLRGGQWYKVVKCFPSRYFEAGHGVLIEGYDAPLSINWFEEHKKA